MTIMVNSVAWAIIAILFLILSSYSMKSYYSFEKKHKKGNLKVQQIWESNMDDIVEIFTQCFKELAVISMLACVVSIVAALLPIFM